jgi:hypothetical protein
MAQARSTDMESQILGKGLGKISGKKIVKTLLL